MPVGSIMMDIEGTELTDEDRDLLTHPLIGGLIYFARNFESAEQIKQLSQAIKMIRPEIVIAVDQEGGRVQRFKEGFTRLPAMQKFLAPYHQDKESTLKLVEDCGWLMAAELLAVGVDFSFAPVLDVDDDYCSVIGDRSFSNKPEEVAVLGDAWIRGMQQAGMAAVGKHFPGHGSVRGDSHLVSPVDNRTYEQIDNKDLIPFKSLLANLQGLMPAHIIFSEIDAEPAGFSKVWLQDILRQKLGFSGVIFSDDLSMAGAAIKGEYGARVAAAFTAGCDMALICNNREGLKCALDSLDGKLDDRLDKKLDNKTKSVRPQASSKLLTMQAQLRDDWNNDRFQERQQRTRLNIVNLLGQQR